MYFKANVMTVDLLQLLRSEVRLSTCLPSFGKPMLLMETLVLQSTTFTNLTSFQSVFYSSSLQQWRTLLDSIKRAKNLMVKN
jgi:hypothetical protein